MNFEDPDKLLKFKFGREEYCQRMLTSLILASRYPKWNSHSTPSETGQSFLCQLFELTYADSLAGPLDFVDEFSLRSVVSNMKDGAPDYAVLTPDRLWIIELKTEKGSHRKDQMPYYQELARYHYPNLHLDLLYLTPEMQRQNIEEFEESRFAHVCWSEMLHLISECWSESEHADERLLMAALQQELGNLDRSSKTFSTEAKIIREALKFAAGVQLDGKQQAVEVPASGLEDLIELRARIGTAIARDPEMPNVRPWIWYENTSGGKPLTELGRSVGCELRLSRYQ